MNTLSTSLEQKETGAQNSPSNSPQTWLNPDRLAQILVVITLVAMIGGLVAELVDALGRSGRSRATSRHPDRARTRTYGKVALVSANVDVRGTAPGMLATQ